MVKSTQLVLPPFSHETWAQFPNFSKSPNSSPVNGGAVIGS